MELDDIKKKCFIYCYGTVRKFEGDEVNIFAETVSYIDDTVAFRLGQALNAIH